MLKLREVRISVASLCEGPPQSRITWDCLRKLAPSKLQLTIAIAHPFLGMITVAVGAHHGLWNYFEFIPQSMGSGSLTAVRVFFIIRKGLP